MNCTSSSNTLVPVRQQSISKPVIPKVQQSATGSWKGKAWNFIKAVPNPCYYLCKYPVWALGAAILAGNVRGTAAVAGKRTDCLKFLGNDLGVSHSKVWRWQPKDHGTVVYTLRTSALYEVPLKETKPFKMPSQTIAPLFIKALKRPSAVDLKNMTITGNIFFNRTPYIIQSIYVQHDGMITRLEFAPTVPKYSAVKIDSKFAGANVFHMTPLGNNYYDFDSDLVRSTPSARAVTEPERDWVERIQMYERYWLNSPGTLCEISQQLDYCDYADDFLECTDSPLKLAADTHFAQSVSGVTMQVWVDDHPGVVKPNEQPTLELVNSTRVASYPLRLTSEILSSGLSDSPEKASMATRNLIHEYYHNLGFSNRLSLTSQTSLDALFKSKAALEFPDHPGDYYTPANLLVYVRWLGYGKYMFLLFTAEDASDIRLRLLSTQQLKARVMVITAENYKLFLDFKETLRSHVYLSFYSRESDQMATVVLSQATAEVSGQEAVSRLSQPGILARMLAKDDEVIIKTNQDARLSDLFLPELIDTAMKSVVVESQADHPTTIHHKHGEEYVHKDITTRCMHLVNRWSCVRFKDADSDSESDLDLDLDSDSE